MNRLLITVAALAAAVPSPAQRGNRGGGDVFGYLARKYDQDGDGRITAAEYNREFQRDAAKFKDYDRNGDGVITRDDLAGGGAPRRGGGRNRGPAGTEPVPVGPAIAGTLADDADADGNGKVTRDEWQQAVANLDRSRDGIVDAGELNGVMRAALGRGTLSERATARRARHLDTDGDGVVQLRELQAMFAGIDHDGNGELTATEIAAMRPVVQGEPKVGDPAPDFSLPLVADRKTQVRLSSFRGSKPVALIFGSYT